MFKNLLGNLIEAVFANKTGWITSLIETAFANKQGYIAAQCLPNGNYITQESASAHGSIVIPFDGWVRVQARCNGLQANSGECVATINYQNNQWPSIVLPARKGTQLAYSVIDGFSGSVSIWFIHNQTNQ